MLTVQGKKTLVTSFNNDFTSFAYYESSSGLKANSNKG